MRPVTSADILKADKRLQVCVLQAFENPEKIIYQGAKCDYSEEPIHERDTEGVDFGLFIIDKLLGNDRGHWGPLEHAAITLSCSGFEHSVMVQARTHRVGVSFDVQSQRYTSKRVLRCGAGELEVDDVFYFRPAGLYTDRKGAKYEYKDEHILQDMERCFDQCVRYRYRVNHLGYAEEHARSFLPQNIRQNFVVSFNLRSLLHFMDLRFKKDAQLEIQTLCEAMAPIAAEWAPSVWSYYENKRLHKAKLAP
jgi:thymidylate synthase (FAD)